MCDFYKIRFKLAGDGVYFDVNEPLHLDALVAAALAPEKIGAQCDTHSRRDDVPLTFELPFAKHQVQGGFVYRASALMIEGDSKDTIGFWRKRFRQNRADMVSGSPRLDASMYREYNQPKPLILCRAMIAFCATDRINEIKSALGKIKYIGKKTSQGHGRISEIEYEKIDCDYSILRDGNAMRYLPHASGWKSVRREPPYWNIHNRVMCLVPGDSINNKKASAPVGAGHGQGQLSPNQPRRI